MNISPPPPPIPRRTTPRALPPAARGATAGIFIFGAMLFAIVFWWFFCRIEPGPDQIAILIRKTGTDLLPTQILATEEGQKGIQLEVLPEGRYFKNPYTWGWRFHRITDIPAGKLGVQTRLYGNDLPAGAIMAQEGTKGIVADVLRPGKYRINPYAFKVELFDAISIRPGSVGVITSLVGEDILNHEIPAAERNEFLVKTGRKGVVNEVLDPGTYYLNPYLVNVVEVNLQSQRFELSGEDVISFLTMDGFTVNVEGTIEFSIERSSAALLTHRIGDMEDVLKKIILPRARGFSRIEGSKQPAINFIVGETRQQFQNNLDSHLRDKCEPWGVSVKSVLVRNILPPDQIASVIREREVAVQNARMFEQQIEQAKSKAELVRQEMLAVQNKEKVEQETVRIRAVIRAQQDQAVRVTAAERELDVARLERDAAAFQAQAQVARATAERDVIKLDNEAQAAVIANQVAAFAGGANLARYALYLKIGPRIGSILSNDKEDGLGELFKSFLPASKGGQP
ncbi:MAG TPA: SPFH domain-containing protein [Kiritimatiellia bacterium]|nr:SPFH domain-containing protein [Kiritimatiellia bacterium]